MKNIALFIVLFIIASIAFPSKGYGQCLSHFNKFTIGTDFSYISVFKKGYKDLNTKDVRLFGYAFKPKVLMLSYKNWKFGTSFYYEQFRDVTADSMIYPVKRGIGLASRYQCTLSEKRKFYFYIEPQIFINNYSPISKKNYLSNYSKNWNQPELVLSISISKHIYKGIHLCLGKYFAYFSKTNKLYLDSSGFIALEYCLKKEKNLKR
ncbi:MAG: hypothetical protein WCR52_20425 [Bacteroidota bacterium]